MGTRVDDSRQTNTQDNSVWLQNSILKAWEYIFVKGVGVTRKWVCDILDGTSQLPNQVCALMLWTHCLLTVIMSRLPSLHNYLSMDSISFQWLWSISSMNSSLASGKQYWPTSLGSYTPPKRRTEFSYLTRGKSFWISLMHILNIYLRFHDIPTFGWGTIRHFADNVSEMKKLAGRDFEDILQVRFIIFVK